MLEVANCWQICARTARFHRSRSSFFCVIDQSSSSNPAAINSSHHSGLGELIAAQLGGILDPNSLCGLSLWKSGCAPFRKKMPMHGSEAVGWRNTWRYLGHSWNFGNDRQMGCGFLAAPLFLWIRLSSARMCRNCCLEGRASEAAAGCLKGDQTAMGFNAEKG